MNDFEENAAVLVHEEWMMMCQDLPKRQPAELAEAFEPFSTMPSMLWITFYSGDLQSGATESSLQSTRQIKYHSAICQHI